MIENRIIPTLDNKHQAMIVFWEDDNGKLCRAIGFMDQEKSNEKHAVLITSDTSSGRKVLEIDGGWLGHGLCDLMNGIKRGYINPSPPYE